MIHFDNLAQERGAETAHGSEHPGKDKQDAEGGNWDDSAEEVTSIFSSVFTQMR